MIRFIRTNARCQPVGESHGMCRYPDAAVEQARTLRAAGASLRCIAGITGAHWTTVSYWIKSGRHPHVRVIAQRRPVDHAGTKPGADSACGRTAASPQRNPTVTTEVTTP